MLRTIFVIAILCIGLYYAVQSAFYSLLLYLWLAYFRPDQWLWIDFVSGWNLSFIVGLLTIVATAFSREKFKFNARIGCLALFFVHCVLSAAFSDTTDVALFRLKDFFKWILMTYVIVVMITDTSRFRTLLLVIALSLGLEAGKQGWANLVLNPGGSNANENPMLGDNNGVAVGMLMLVPVLTMLASTADRKWERWLHRLLVIGVLNRAITTYSRGGFLSCVALGLVYAARSPRRVPAIAGMIVAAVIILPVLPDAFWDRMSTIKPVGGIAAEDTSTLGRLHFWAVAVRMANQNPILGVGYNAFNENYNRYDDSGGLYGGNRSVHSAWFGVLAELGYPGLALFVGQIVLAFAACRRARRASKIGPEHASLGQFAFALEAGLIVFIVGGSFLPFQYTEMLWHWLGLTIALNDLAVAALASRSKPLTPAAVVAAPISSGNAAPIARELPLRPAARLRLRIEE